MSYRAEFPPVRRFGRLPSITTNYAQPVVYRLDTGAWVCPNCANQRPAEQVLAGHINYTLTTCPACLQPLQVAHP
jgi:hypothetical protein